MRSGLLLGRHNARSFSGDIGYNVRLGRKIEDDKLAREWPDYRKDLVAAKVVARVQTEMGNVVDSELWRAYWVSQVQPDVPVDPCLDCDGDGGKRCDGCGEPHDGR